MRSSSASSSFSTWCGAPENVAAGTFSVRLTIGRNLSCSIFQLLLSFISRAVSTAEEDSAFGLKPVPNNARTRNARRSVPMRESRTRKNRRRELFLPSGPRTICHSHFHSSRMLPWQPPSKATQISKSTHTPPSILPLTCRLPSSRLRDRRF